jgi:hypothetical protein
MCVFINKTLILNNHFLLELGRFCASPMMTQQLSQFSREVVDLLKHSPQCRMPFSKFIPAYHHHFGRQCRVADYGYTKLMELFEAIPHIVQVGSLAATVTPCYLSPPPSPIRRIWFCLFASSPFL